MNAIDNQRIKDTIEFHPIGVIHTSFTKLEGMPIQPAGAVDVKGTVEVFEDFRSGLKDLDGFSHIILLYYFHQSQSFNLHVVPFLDSESRIKPYVPEFDVRMEARIGWLEKARKNIFNRKSDDRFK